jgi:Zn-dependent protease with chaperone function
MVADSEPPWPLIAAVVVLVPEMINLAAFMLQRSRIGSPVPDQLKGIYDDKEYEESLKYTKAKSDLKLVKDIWDLFFFYAFWFLGGFPLFDSMAVSLGLSERITGLAFFGLIGLLFFVIDIPWSVYTTFVLEESFGFNKTTIGTFVKDRVKGMALTVAIGAPLLWIVLWFFMTFQEAGWLYVFLTIAVFQLVMLFLSPVLILPLFLEMIDLPEGNALISDEGDEKAGSRDFLKPRVFYGHESTPNEKPSWMTKDRRFQSAGAKLSVFAKEDKWVIAEGEPGSEDGKVYAISDIDSSSELDSSSTWTLTDEGKEALKPKSDSAEETPLKESFVLKKVDVGSLRKRLLDLANRLGYVGANIFVIDGSTRSSHSNAFCTGFGKYRRVCLFDTLLPLMDEDEIIAILGHEIGHDRLYHVHISMVIAMTFMAIQFYILGQCIASKAISLAFFCPETKVYLGFCFFGFLWSVVEFVFSIPMTISTRRNEYAADRYSIDADKSHATTLANGLKKMMRKSKANLTPHPFYVFLTYSHPPLDHRLKAMEDYTKKLK